MRPPVAIVDIGSNSVRLVVYEALKRNPVPLFNEKILAGLGEAVGSTGRLSGQSVERALGALRRFRALADHMGIERLHVLATAAVREAENGAAFVEAGEAVCRGPIEILSGAREAHLTALGVVSGVHRADGVAGDLGGGSLELVDIRDEAVGAGVTLPLGGLRLSDVSGRSLRRAEAMARAALGACRLLDKAKGRSFYAIGGTWRALGRLHMTQTGYPLHVAHHYALPAKDAVDFAQLVKQAAPGALASIDVVNEARQPLLAYGALVLEHVVRQGRPKTVVFSALGVREGLLYDLLDPEERRRDVLLAAAEELASLLGRSLAHGQQLCAWTDRLFGSARIEESAEETRLRHAACLLSDIAWRAHPDYRGEEALEAIAYANVAGIDHVGRAFLALAVYHRYVGAGDDRGMVRLRPLLTAKLLERARLVGLACRLAYVLSASVPGVLPQIALTVRGKQLVLTLPEALAALEGRRVHGRLRQLAKLLGLESVVEA